MVLLKDLRHYALYIFLAFCLLASSTPLLPQGMFFYLLGISICFLYSITHKRNSHKATFFWMFLMACYCSCLVNMVFDYRLFVFTFVLITCTPILYSEKIYQFREKYLKCCLQFFPVVSIICLYCYFKGINMMSPEDGDVSWDFSAIFPHSMWLAAAVGISNVVCLWNIFNTKKKTYQFIWILMLLQSVYLSVVSASRSALAASLLSMVLLVFFNVKNIKKLIKYIGLISIIATLTFPLYYENSQRMQNKIDSSEGKYGSRTEIFTDGFTHFVEQPVFGCGFAVSYRAGHRDVGRLESGSGWLSILFQTGIFGFVVMVLILKQMKNRIVSIRSDKKLQLFFTPFFFLCLHSCFEGYILTSGYYLCLLFWTLLSYLYTYHETSAVR